jgi:hypothetical protein
MIIQAKQSVQTRFLEYPGDVRFAPKATIADQNVFRRFVKSGCEQSQQGKPLFDHLVGGQQQTGRHFEAERSGGLQVDDKLELGRLRDR